MKLWVSVLMVVLCWQNVPSVTALTKEQVGGIIAYFDETFGFTRQYAYAVTFNDCRHVGSKNNVKNTLKLGKDEIQNIKNEINAERIYEGNQLVMSTYTGNGNRARHSEFRLLTRLEDNVPSPVEKLMERQKNAKCVLFFSLNSPCLDRCLQAENQKSIIDKLDIFKKINDRAFVYSVVYRKDVANPNLENELKTVNGKMPLYLCKGKKCIECVGSKSDMNKECLKE